MKKIAAVLLLISLGWPSLALASRVTIFEKAYERKGGQPNEYDDTFPLSAGIQAPYFLTASGPPNLQVTLNGQPVNGSLVDHPVTLGQMNALHVRLTGQKGMCTITVTGEQSAPPPPVTRDLLPPTLFTRVAGTPEDMVTPFTVPEGLPGPFTLRVESGSASGRNRVTSGEIRVDGGVILGSSAFKKEVGEIEKEIAISAGPHTLGVKIKGKPGTYLVVSIRQGAANLGTIATISGDGQNGVILTPLPAPFVVKLTSLNGGSAAGQKVYWKTARGDGKLDGGPMQKVTQTDATGQAQVLLTLGSHSGEGMNEVEAYAPGFGRVLFAANALPGAAAQIHPWKGENQRGMVGQTAPEPLEVLVRDAGMNPVQGVTVEFHVEKGDGSFGGSANGSATTDSRGIASIALTLGPNPGYASDMVKATFAGYSGYPATFVLSTLAAHPGQPAAVQGVVLDEASLPFQGLKVTARGTGLFAMTSAEGQFLIPGLVEGWVKLDLDPSTSGRPGEYSTVTKNLYLLPGIINQVPTSLHIIKLEDRPESKQVVGGLEEKTLTIPELDGFSITVFPRSTILDGLRKPVPLSASQIKAGFMLVDPPTALGIPTMGCTARPAETLFDPPARVTFPNVMGFAPNRVVTLYTVNYDTGVYEFACTGQVSQDGLTISTDEGQGMRRGSCEYVAGEDGGGDVECPPRMVPSGNGCVCDPALRTGCSPIPPWSWDENTCTCSCADLRCSDPWVPDHDACECVCPADLCSPYPTDMESCTCICSADPTARVQHVDCQTNGLAACLGCADDCRSIQHDCVDRRRPADPPDVHFYYVITGKCQNDACVLDSQEYCPRGCKKDYNGCQICQ